MASFTQASAGKNHAERNIILTVDYCGVNIRVFVCSYMGNFCCDFTCDSFVGFKLSEEIWRQKFLHLLSVNLVLNRN